MKNKQVKQMIVSEIGNCDFVSLIGPLTGRYISGLFYTINIDGDIYLTSRAGLGVVSIKAIDYEK